MEILRKRCAYPPAPNFGEGRPKCKPGKVPPPHEPGHQSLHSTILSTPVMASTQSRSGCVPHGHPNLFHGGFLGAPFGGGCCGIYDYPSNVNVEYIILLTLHTLRVFVRTSLSLKWLKALVQVLGGDIIFSSHSIDPYCHPKGSPALLYLPGQLFCHDYFREGQPGREE